MHDFILTSSLDWRPCLKPPIISRSLRFLHEAQEEAVDSIGRPSKRQQGDTPYLSPYSSASATITAAGLSMPPPPPPQPDLPHIKTPRPDISIGLRDAVVLSALQSQGLTKDSAEEFLECLQEANARNRSEPALVSMPTQRAEDIRFPFLLVEGKAYATGKPVYDAQNQVAVAGACALNILHDLDHLAGSTDSGGPSNDQPMAFGVCTEGPYHELWAHYTTMEDSVRRFNMILLKTCNAVALYSDLEGFLVAVDNVMSWGAVNFSENVTKQMRKVVKMVGFS